ncbi:hypothetical protein BC938DRAFT_481952 [Jimgerdemannia flammicorona]|uniref:Uncharacterized protein n=1 Tax=Jimgerdemannia flammicorona TaxID=994334 RepID=A0A433QF49_9FUNG|nr:hypothetical protein BC938DRAFT_481952 [Jimgerdemannia flammicorona]
MVMYPFSQHRSASRIRYSIFGLFTPPRRRLAPVRPISETEQRQRQHLRGSRFPQDLGCDIFHFGLHGRALNRQWFQVVGGSGVVTELPLA